MEGLRLDEDFLQQDFNVERFKECAEKFHSKALSKRVEILLKSYDI
jgi:hypothetical protein